MYWNIDICAMAMPFFFCGYMYKQQGHVFDDCFMRHLRITALTFLILNVSFAYLVGGGIDMFGGSYGLFPLTYITALCGIFFSVQLSKIVSFPFIRYIGKNSIIYFAWHQTIVYPIVWKMLSIMNFPFTNSAPILIVLEKCLELILILSITTTINEVIIRSRFKFIIGK